ncbi:hypothetical protein GOP47_0010966 [Adiantum capillus-veneris]|uniref:Uncharacterized protein n=1 Tax=Adiantum capillus-veneris TaxID=13818 RepID=A0A9D4UWC0_ADICA|nr:hypothetical protein GOP47_0010966 [Adiantum capillus-veneris]
MEQESWKTDKGETGCQPPEGPILCANNCGFFGSASSMNLCSQCYRSHVFKQTKTVEAAALLASKQADLQSEVTSCPLTEATGGEESTTSASSSSSAEVTHQQPNRCFTCKKRVGLTGFKCRCGNQFCALHRHHDKHNCSYDYRSAARDAIAKANPAIRTEKLDKL